jgi:GTP cyclohydrolase I
MNLKIEVRGIADTLKQVEQDYHAFLERVADTIVEEAPKFTPKRTGKAAASWEKRMSKDNFEVTNTTDYAQYLEKPYVKSKQAPRGIIGPTLTSVKGKLR